MNAARALLLCTTLPLAAWGPKGHRLAAAGALATLPPGLRAWYAGAEARFVEASLDADRAKAGDPEEDDRHHLHVEAYGGPERVPQEAEAAQARLGPLLFRRRGTLPWALQDRYRRLVAAFRAGDRERVIQEGAWVCHYTADAQVPLHTTLNSNGRKTGQKGVHKRWETTLVAWKVEALATPRPARAPARPLAEAFAWIAEAHALVPALLAADSRAGDLSGEPGEDPAWAAFWASERERIETQLRRAAERTGDLLLAAWAEAGSAPRPESP